MDGNGRTRRARLGAALLTLLGATAHARGVTPYLPLQLSPEIERKIERLLVLAGEPILTRPIAAARVLDALPRACDLDAVLCADVRRYLSGFMRTGGIAYAGVSVAEGSGADTPLPNRRGMTSQSSYELAGSAYWQPADRFLVTAGAVVYDDDSVPTGTVVSFGNELAQFDIGYRDHWLSPLTDSAMLLSTQAETLPSITISNYGPISRWKLRYEGFVAEMSESANILFEGNYTSGKPLLAGVHVSIEPVPGWSIGVNRLLQFGGGDRPDSFRDLLEAFIDPSSDNVGTTGDTTDEFGNQLASITTRFVMPGRIPFATYFEYAGEDTSTTSNARLGNVALAAGIELPRIGQRFALTFEATEWQNSWYVHHIYADGLRHKGRVLGHWGGDRRVVGDGVGARSFMVRLGFSAREDRHLEATYRTLENEGYGAAAYERASQLDIRYSRPWQEFFVGAELTGGRDVDGESFARASAFLRF